MCDYCDVIEKENINKKGEPEEGIFYNEKENRFYLIIEQFRYERAKIEIRHCHWCGSELKVI